MMVKRTLYAASLGVLLGFGVVIAHEIMNDTEFQRTVREGAKSVRNMVDTVRNKQEEAKEPVWEEAPSDPEANRAWVESQWEEVLG